MDSWVKISTKNCSWKRNTSNAWNRYSTNTMKFSKSAERWNFRRKYTRIDWQIYKPTFKRRKNDSLVKTKCWKNYIVTKILLSLVSACQAMLQDSIFLLCLLPKTKRHSKSGPCVKITQATSWKHQTFTSKTQLVNTKEKKYQNITRKAVHFLKKIWSIKFIASTKRFNKSGRIWQKNSRHIGDSLILISYKFI